MKEELISKAINSIAFNTVAVKKINDEFAEIDERLFAFAYYTPVPHSKNAHACFYLAVLNMYKLIWDCGPMVNNLLWDIRKKQSPIPSNILQELRFWQKLGNLIKLVQHIRSDICHNNFADYYFYKVSHDAHEKFLKQYSGSSASEISSEADWELICDIFLDLCQSFYDNLREAIAEIKKISEEQRKIFVNLWLQYIEKWYKRNLEISLNVLADLYPLSLGQKGVLLKKVSRSDIYKWISGESGAQGKESCLRTISSILEENLGSHMQSPDCPTPAFPKPVLFNIFKSEKILAWPLTSAAVSGRSAPDGIAP